MDTTDPGCRPGSRSPGRRSPRLDRASRHLPYSRGPARGRAPKASAPRALSSPGGMGRGKRGGHTRARDLLRCRLPTSLEHSRKASFHESPSSRARDNCLGSLPLRDRRSSPLTASPRRPLPRSEDAFIERESHPRAKNALGWPWSVLPNRPQAASAILHIGEVTVTRRK